MTIFIFGWSLPLNTVWAIGATTNKPLKGIAHYNICTTSAPCFQINGRASVVISNPVKPLKKKKTDCHSVRFPWCQQTSHFTCKPFTKFINAVTLTGPTFVTCTKTLNTYVPASTCVCSQSLASQTSHFLHHSFSVYHSFSSLISPFLYF